MHCQGSPESSKKPAVQHRKMCSFREVLKEVHCFFRFFPSFAAHIQFCLSINCSANISSPHILHSFAHLQLVKGLRCNITTSQETGLCYSCLFWSWVPWISASQRGHLSNPVKPLERITAANMQSGLQKPDKTGTWPSRTDVYAVLDK